MAFFPEQEYKVSTKSDDELRKFTLEEDLTELQRSYQLITKGSQLQKKAIYLNLHIILRDPKAFEGFFKVLREEVQQQEEDYQIICACSMKKFIEHQKCQDGNMLQIFGLCCKILVVWSQPVLDAWYQVLDAIIHHINVDQIWKDVQNLALTLSDANQPTVSRYIACRVIGSLAEIAKDKIKGPLFDKARILCQDPDVEIRKVMAEEVLLKICNNISTELLEVYMLEKILELVYDADIGVKGGAVCTIFSIAKNLSLEERKHRIVKIFYDLLVSQNEEMVKKMSRLSGPTFETLHPFISQNLAQHIQFLGIFREYGLNRNPKVRKNFAYNFPGVLSLADPKKFDFFQESYMKCLSNNDYPDVQKPLVCSFGEVIKLTHLEFLECLGNKFCQLLISKNKCVLHSLIPQYKQIVTQFASKDMEQAQEENKESSNQNELMIKLFIQLFDNSMEMLAYLQDENHWEMQQTFYEQFLITQEHFQNGYFNHELFISQIQRSFTNSTQKVRRICCFNVAKYLSWLPDLRKRNELIQCMIVLLYESQSFYQRLGFLDFIEGASYLFSRKFFQQNQIFRVFLYAKDKVGCVQAQLAKIMPILKSKIHPEDEETQEQYKQAFDHLLTIKQKWLIDVVKDMKRENDKAILNEQDLNEKDLLLQKTEEDYYYVDLKARQELDQQKDDFDINIRSDFVNDYLSKYRKRLTIFGGKQGTNKHKLISSHSQSNLATKLSINSTKLQPLSNDLQSKSLQKKSIFQSQHDSDVSFKGKDDQRKQIISKIHGPMKLSDQKLSQRKNSPDVIKLPQKKTDPTIQSFKLPIIANNNKK